MTMLSELLECADHCLQRFDFGAQLGDVIQRKSPHVGTRSASIAPQGNECRDLLHGKAKRTCALDESQRVHVGVVEGSVVSGCPFRRGNQTDRLIVPDHFCRHAGRSSSFADAVLMSV